MPKLPNVPFGGQPPVPNPAAVQQAIKDAHNNHPHAQLVNSLEAYVSGPGGIRQYNTVTHGAEGTFTHDGPSDDLGAFAFGTDGRLYVIAHPNPSLDPNPLKAPSVVAYDDQSGAFLGTFMPTLKDPGADPGFGTAASALAVSPNNGDLYVGVYHQEVPPGSNGPDFFGTVERYDAKTGALKPSDFTPNQMGRPNALAFGADGSLYVGDFSNNVNSPSSVYHFDQSGNLLPQFQFASGASVDGGSSRNGLAVSGNTLYVADGDGSIDRYDATTGKYLDTGSPPFINHEGSGAYAVGGLALGPDGFLYANFDSTPGHKKGSTVDRYDLAGTFLDSVPIPDAAGLALRTNAPFVELTA